MAESMEDPGLRVVAAPQIDHRPVCGNELREMPIDGQKSQEFLVNLGIHIRIRREYGLPLISWDEVRDGA